MLRIHPKNRNMNRSLGRRLLAAASVLCISASVSAQQAAGPQTVEAYQGRAKNEAGLEWAGTFLRLCIPPAPAAAPVAPATVAAAPAPANPAPAAVTPVSPTAPTAAAPAPARDTWFAEP